MKDEPEIIKMLRVEEKLGKLKGKIQSTYESLETLEESPEDVENETSVVEDEAPKGQKIEDTAHYEIKSDELYRNLVEMASDAIVIVDLKGVIISCNTAALRMIGHTKEEYVGKRFSELGIFRKQDIPKFLKIFATIIRGRASSPIEFIFHRMDGATGWAEGRASLLKKNRKIVGLQVIIRDITDRKRDEKKLKESEEKFRDLFENANDLIQSVDLNGNFVYVNKKWLDTLGYSKNEIRMLKLIDILRKDQVPHCMELFKKVCEGKAFEHIEVVFVSKDGKEIYVEGNVNPWFKDGRFIATRGIFRDITERKHAEEKIRESRQHFQQLFNSIADPVVIVDSKGKLLEISDKLEKITGFKIEELIGKNFLTRNIVTKRSKSTIIKNLAKRMIGSKITPYEIEVLTKDGKKLPFEINAAKIKYKGKAADMVVFRDITERKQAEEEIKRARDDYLSITNLTGDIIVKVDADGRWSFLNDGACQFWGKSREELIGSTFADYLHPDDLEKTMAAIEECKNQKLKKVVVNRQKTPMGWRTVEWNGIGVYDREGRYLGFQATGRDITKRMETEMAFRENEKKYRFLVNTAQELIFIINNTGKILFVNKYAIETTGYTEEEIIGKRITHFLTRDSIKKALFALTQELLGKPQPEMRVKIKTKTGEIKILDVANETTRVYGQDGKLNNLYIVARDVTNQLEAERELKESKEELEKLNNELERKVFERTEEIEKLLQQKDAFINQLSHDLRSPLTPLTALLPMIEEKEQDPHLKEDLGVIHCNVKYLNALIGKTIELAQLNSPKTKFSFDTTTLLDEIKAVVKNNKLVFEKNDIKIKNKVDKHILVKTDKLRFRQLFDNLISNAVKYSPHGGTITIDAQDDGGWVTVSIKDTGIGMIREELNHIFEEFYKADWSRHDHMSSGLGLSICKSIVKKHGGRIWAESPGKRKGTTVFFTIPSSSKEGGNK